MKKLYSEPTFDVTKFLFEDTLNDDFVGTPSDPVEGDLGIEGGDGDW
ncbi:MAG: hypothetical protein U0L20_00830 [Ruminococcus sp.]|nr:hypothetical protein [Ruminococcus sp.]